MKVTYKQRERCCPILHEIGAEVQHPEVRDSLRDVICTNIVEINGLLYLYRGQYVYCTIAKEFIVSIE